MALPKLPCIAWQDRTLPFNLLFLSSFGVSLGSQYDGFLDLYQIPASFLLTVISPNINLACLIMPWHVLKNRQRTKTNIPSLLPNCLTLKFKSSLQPKVPFIINLLFTFFKNFFYLFLFFAPSTLLYSYSFPMLSSLAPPASS